MIKKQDIPIPWYERYRDPKKFKDDPNFIDGYNQALEDFTTLFGTAKRPGENYRNAGIHGGNQVQEACEKWRLEYIR